MSFTQPRLRSQIIFWLLFSFCLAVSSHAWAQRSFLETDPFAQPRLAEQSYPNPIEAPAQAYPTLFILITPDLLLSPKDQTSPRFEHDQLDNRLVTSDGITQSRVALAAAASPSSIGVRVNVAGVTSSEAVTAIGQRAVFSRDVTHFSADQMVELSMYEFKAQEPTIAAETQRSFSDVYSDRLIGSRAEEMAVTQAFGQFQSTIDERASDFAKQKLKRELAQQTSAAEQRYHEKLGEFLSRGQMPNEFFFPEWQQIHLSSTDRVWRFQSDFQYVGANPPPLHVLPVSARVHEHPINSQIQRQFAGRRLDAAEMQNLHSQLSNKFSLPAAQSATDKPWSLTLAASQPVQLNFDQNSVRITITADEITSGKKSLPPTKIELRYSLQYRGGKWFAVRDERVEVSAVDESERLGARQQIVKTVTRKRFARLFPEEFAIPGYQFTAGDGPNASSFDLEVKTITTQNGWLSFSMGHKFRRR